MKALILIKGASQQAVETEIKREVHLLGGDNNSITSLQLFATGMANIRDVIPFPRTPNTAEF